MQRQLFIAPRAGPALLKLAPPMSALIGDKGYDGDGFRAKSSVTARILSFQRQQSELAKCNNGRLFLPAEDSRG
jgi:hypothetical protein